MMAPAHQHPLPALDPPPTTLASLFLQRCAAGGEQPAFVFVRGALDQLDEISHTALAQRSMAIASQLLRQTSFGDRVLVVLPPGLDFVAAFWACLLTGRVAVPVPAPDAARFKNSAAQLRTVTSDADAAAILCTRELQATLQSLPAVFEVDAARFLLLENCAPSAIDEPGVLAAAKAVQPDSLAYLQYTSGSTTAPRGVMLSHQQALGQCRIGAAAQQLNPSSRILCWLPHHHDYGLVLGALWPVYSGARAYLMSPLTFLRRPLRWLEAVERFAITHTGAPNFAYAACSKALADAPRWAARLDSLRDCSCGAEPIHAETIRRFQRAFAPHGLRAEALKPAYGMAETVLGISNTRPERGFEVDTLDGAALAQHRVVRVAADAAHAVPVVACGQAFDEMQVIAVQPEQGLDLGDDHVGELWVRGVSVGSGYWKQPELSSETFGASLADGSGPWLRTGDLGYLHRGTVHVTGRLKDLIILRGRNVYPQDIEWAAQAVDPNLRAGHGAAFTIEHEGAEAVVLVQEFDKRERDADLPALAAAIRRALAIEHELPLHSLLLVRSGSLPRTSSGKIRRRSCQQLYRDGELQLLHQEVFNPLAATARLSDLSALLERLGAAQGAAAQQATIADLLLTVAADALGRAPHELSLAASAVENGLDSLSVVRALARLDEALGLSLAPSALLSLPDLASSAHAVWQSWQDGAQAANAGEALAGLDAADAERLAAAVPGGAANVQHMQRLTPLQQGLLLLSQLQTRGDAYLVRQISDFGDRAALDRALHALGRVQLRHTAWRTLIAWEGLPHPVQLVLREAPLPLTEHQPVDGLNALAQLEALTDPAEHALDLGQAPLLRCDVLHDREQGRWLLSLRLHHLVMDQVSLELVREELQAIADGREAELAPAPAYADFVQTVRGQDSQTQQNFFREHFAGLSSGTQAFGLARSDAATPPGQIQRHRARLPHALAAQLRRAVREQRSSSAALVHTAWALVLARATQSNDLVFGSVLSGRLSTPARLGRAVGLFVNTLPLRLRLDGLSAAEALRHTSEALSALVQHEHTPLALAQQAAGLPAGDSLFNATLNLRHVSASQPAALGRLLSSWERTHFPIAVSVNDHGEDFSIDTQCADGLDPAALSAQLLQALHGLSAALIEAPDASVLAIDTLPAEQREQQLKAWGQHVDASLSPEPVHRLIEAQAMATPTAEAVRFGQASLSYAELNAQANQLARELQQRGIGPGQLVGLHLQRSLDMPTAYLAVLKCGAAFLPLDPELPTARLAQLVQETGSPLLITQATLRPALQEALGDHTPQWLLLDQPAVSLATQSPDNLDLRLAPEALAYVLHTSGSTGAPKGVMLPQRALGNVLQWTARATGLQPGDRWLQKISTGFDPSLLDLLTPLTVGATTVLAAPGVQAFSDELVQTLRDQAITHVILVPSQLRVLIDEPALPDCRALRYVIAGGEALDEELALRLSRRLPGVALGNFYGPTETCIVSLQQAWLAGDGADGAVPIGRPIANTQALLLDAQHRLLPAGAPGELFIGGAGLALGYLGREDLTAERFITHPFDPAQRLYATGDLARWLPDGRLLYLGRADQQVKVRGVRIELGEIEAALNALPQVKQAVVLLRQDPAGQPRLVAYVVGEAGWQAEQLRAALTAQLPQAMVPAHFVALERIPLLSSGKADRKALPAPQDVDSASTLEPAQGPQETLLAAAWADLLALPQVGRQQNFFHLGGHSLLAMQLVSRLREAQLCIEVREVYEHPTLAELALRLRPLAADSAASPRGVPAGSTQITPEMLPLAGLDAEALARVLAQVPDGAANVQDIYRLAPLQEGLLFQHRLDSADDFYASRSVLSFPDEAALQAHLAALRQVLARHEAWRSLFLWDQLPHAVQVVLRDLALPVQTVAIEPGADVLRTLEQASDPALHRLDVRQAPLLRCLIAHDPAQSRWLLVMRQHHLIADHVSNELVQQEITALLDGRDPAALPPAASYRDFVQATLAADEAAQRAHFERELADVQAPTAPFGLLSLPSGRVHGHQQRVADSLAADMRAAARQHGATPAALVHTAWALVLAQTSRRSDVVFGTVLSGRLAQQGAFARTVGLLINTLPLRVRLNGLSAVAALQQVRTGLQALLPHEQATLSLAQACSGVIAPTPLFTTALNYRHTDAASSLDVHTAAQEASPRARVVASQERSNFPISVAVDDLGTGFSIEAQCAEGIDPAALAEQLLSALQGLTEALLTAPTRAALAMDALGLPFDADRIEVRHPAPPETLGTPADEAPQGELEQALAAHWQQLLGLARVRRQDHFFQLGGHSLLATQLASRLRLDSGVELPLREIFEHPTLSAMALRVAARLAQTPAATTDGGIQPVPRGAPLPVSHSQRRMWLVQQMTPETTAYNMPFGVRLRGPLDMADMQRALDAVAQRHEAFRTRFELIDGEPMQIIGRHQPLSLQTVDLSQLPLAQAEAQALPLIKAIAQRPFDLANGPLHHAHAIRLAADDHVLLWVIHHVVGDAWSTGLLIKEITQAYEALRAGGTPAGRELAIDYADYAVWQGQGEQNERLQQQMAYWREQLAGLEPLQLPVDRPRRGAANGRGGCAIGEFSPATLATLKRFSAERGVTPYMSLLACFSLLLGRIGGQQDLAVGTPIANRQHLALESLVGTFVNTLVMRTRLDGNPRFSELLERVRHTALDAYAHQDSSFDRLVEALTPGRQASSQPLVQVMFNVVNTPSEVRSFAGLTPQAFDFDRGASQFDLSLTIDTEVFGKLYFEYAEDLFEHATVQRLLDGFMGLVEQVLRDPGQPIGSYSVLSAADAAELRAWNATEADYDRQACLHTLMEAQALATPEAVALVHPGVGQWTFAELHQRANSLARRLRQRGIGRGDLVGLCTERGLDMLSAQLAVLKAGAAYVPLDPSYPADRLAYMADDAGLALLISDSSLASLLPWPFDKTLLLDIELLMNAEPGDPLPPNADSDARPQDPAYVIYTSGSTGKPKGVVVQHQAAVNFLGSMAREPGLTPSDTVLAVTTLSFDIAVLELLLPLVVGARTVLASRDDALSGPALAALIAQHGVSVLQATPSSWRMLIEAGWGKTPGLKALIGGEGLPLDLAEQLLARCDTLWNMYGPTETTVWSTCWQVQDPAAGIRIGRPINNTSIQILDEQLQPCPIGVPGEICIGGEGVSLGYHGRPELTAERFVADPQRVGGRLYRTGDRGRWCRDGTLEHHGRMDFQVKLRGHRIELGEIESQLMGHPSVARALLIVREDSPGDQRLVAYLVAAPGAGIEPGPLREHLKASLPDYMLPQHFVALEAMPLLPNGKINRHALPVPQSAAPASGRSDIVAPANQAELLIACVWAELLQIDATQISATDNFFNLGGHSLLAMRAITAIQQRSGVLLQVRQLIFENLTQIARAVPGHDRPLAALPRDLGSEDRFISLDDPEQRGAKPRKRQGSDFN